MPALMPGEDGYLITALPAAAAGQVAWCHSRLRPFVRQRYERSYADLSLGFDAWLARLSANSRSTMKRKARKLADRSGGMLDLRCYRTPDELSEFYEHARQVSAASYQERLLDAGLPQGPGALGAMQALAARDAVRAWLLFIEGRPAAYLYAPAEGDCLLYAYLGYDPAFAAFSPGTVLQYEAMRGLMAERRFRLFDFTEGDGRHKRQFATGTISCVDLLLVRRTLSNLAIGHLINALDHTVALAKRIRTALGRNN